MLVPSISSPTSSTISIDMDRSQEFYFAPLVNFQVDGKAFCVPREGFLQSSRFINHFEISPTGPEQAAITIENANADEFTAFLKLLIRLPLGLKEHGLSEAELESALKLSSLWDFGAVRALAIARLEALSLEPSRIIQLAHLYNVDHWIEPQIERLAFRPESLTVEEAERIGLKTVVEISNHRDTLSRLLSDTVRQHITVQKVARAQASVSAHIRKLREKPVQRQDSASDVVSSDADAERATSSLSDGESFIKVQVVRAESFISQSSESLPIRSEGTEYADRKTHNVSTTVGDADAASDIGDEELARLEAAVIKAKNDLGSAESKLFWARLDLNGIPKRKVQGKGKSPRQKVAEQNIAEAQNKVEDARKRLEDAEKAFQEYDGVMESS